MKFGGKVGGVTRTNWLDFDEDPDMDTRTFFYIKWFFTIDGWGQKLYTVLLNPDIRRGYVPEKFRERQIHECRGIVSMGKGG